MNTLRLFVKRDILLRLNMFPAHGSICSIQVLVVAELRRKGLLELDIAELGRRSSREMVRRYSRADTF